MKQKHLRVADHQLEVVVRVDAGTHVLVVILKLLDRHDLITLVSLPNGHEVREDLVSSLATALEIWVEADIVSNSYIIDSDLSRAILVKDAIGLMDHIETTLVE